MISRLQAGAHRYRESVFYGARDLSRVKEVKQPLPVVPQTPAELVKALLSSIKRLDRGEGVEGAAVLRRLQKRRKEYLSRG
jgi:hypothetical protein